MTTSTCFDVAKYILQEKGPITAMKLQKLVYYTQAWSTVWDEAPLFDEPIEAWINGPIIPDLYEALKEKFLIEAEEIDGNTNNLSANQKETITLVLQYYGDKDSQWLSDLTHLEDPWKKARKGLPPNVRGKNVISLSSMAEYYSSIFE